MPKLYCAEIGFLSANFYAKTIFGEDALMNISVEQNKEGKIVTMGTYKENAGQARIGHVYTPESERGKAYAANLIYEMTKLLLEKELVPLLYTDYNFRLFYMDKP